MRREMSVATLVTLGLLNWVISMSGQKRGYYAGPVTKAHGAYKWSTYCKTFSSAIFFFVYLELSLLYTSTFLGL